MMKRGPVQLTGSLGQIQAILEGEGYTPETLIKCREIRDREPDRETRSRIADLMEGFKLRGVSN